MAMAANTTAHEVVVVAAAAERGVGVVKGMVIW